jgi:hypothetical protein
MFTLILCCLLANAQQPSGDNGLPVNPRKAEDIKKMPKLTPEELFQTNPSQLWLQTTVFNAYDKADYFSLLAGAYAAEMKDRDTFDFTKVESQIDSARYAYERLYGGLQHLSEEERQKAVGKILKSLVDPKFATGTIPFSTYKELGFAIAEEQLEKLRTGQGMNDLQEMLLAVHLTSADLSSPSWANNIPLLKLYQYMQYLQQGFDGEVIPMDHQSLLNKAIGKLNNDANPFSMDGFKMKNNAAWRKFETDFSLDQHQRMVKQLGAGMKLNHDQLKNLQVFMKQEHDRREKEAQLIRDQHQMVRNQDELQRAQHHIDVNAGFGNAMLNFESSLLRAAGAETKESQVFMGLAKVAVDSNRIAKSYDASKQFIENIPALGRPPEELAKIKSNALSDLNIKTIGDVLNVVSLFANLLSGLFAESDRTVILRELREIRNMMQENHRDVMAQLHNMEHREVTRYLMMVSMLNQRFDSLERNFSDRIEAVREDVNEVRHRIDGLREKLPQMLDEIRDFVREEDRKELLEAADLCSSSETYIRNNYGSCMAKFKVAASWGSNQTMHTGSIPVELNVTPEVTETMERRRKERFHRALYDLFAPKQGDETIGDVTWANLRALQFLATQWDVELGVDSMPHPGVYAYCAGMYWKLMERFPDLYAEYDRNDLDRLPPGIKAGEIYLNGVAFDQGLKAITESPELVDHALAEYEDALKNLKTKLQEDTNKALDRRQFTTKQIASLGSIDFRGVDLKGGATQELTGDALPKFTNEGRILAKPYKETYAPNPEKDKGWETFQLALPGNAEVAKILPPEWVMAERLGLGNVEFYWHSPTWGGEFPGRHEKKIIFTNSRQSSEFAKLLHEIEGWYGTPTIVVGAHFRCNDGTEGANIQVRLFADEMVQYYQYSGHWTLAGYTKPYTQEFIEGKRWLREGGVEKDVNLSGVLKDLWPKELQKKFMTQFNETRIKPSAEEAANQIQYNDQLKTQIEAKLALARAYLQENSTRKISQGESGEIEDALRAVTGTERLLRTLSYLDGYSSSSPHPLSKYVASRFRSEMNGFAHRIRQVSDLILNQMENGAKSDQPLILMEIDKEMAALEEARNVKASGSVSANPARESEEMKVHRKIVDQFSQALQEKYKSADPALHPDIYRTLRKLSGEDESPWR